MRKNVKNDKVIRAITIALATMLTVSASPISVLADENAQPDNDTNNSGSESSSEETSSNNESSSSESSSPSEAASVCESASSVIEGSEDVTLPQAIDDASVAVAAIETSFVAPAETIEQIQTELTEAADLVETTNDNVEAAQAGLEAAVLAQGTAATMAGAATASVESVNSGIAVINEADNNASASVENAETYAQTANTSASKEEATAAADSAAAELASVEEGLEKANEAYESASAAAAQAEIEYQAAETAHAQAVAELNKANEAIRNAQGNATAAQERMKAAQAKVDAIEKKVQALAENKEELETIRQHYYNYLVHYYRNDAQTAMYKADGSLDLEASAAKAIETGKAVDPGFCPNTLLLGRDLLKELVTLKLKMEGADADSIVFAAEGKDAKEAAGGILTKDNSKKARVIIDENSRYTQYWENQTGESGRNNRAKVTYTKDGEEHTEYYNYVAKASAYNDTLDLENGTIFLALVEKGEDGKWHAKADESEFSFDDYGKILEAINIAAKASEDMTEYNNARNAVDAATAEVEKLKDELDKINKVSVDGSVIAQLKAALTKAQADLEDAKATRDALAGKVAQARAIVESIDLSRFDRTEETSEIAGEVVTAATTAAPAAVAETAESIPAATVTEEAASTADGGAAETTSTAASAVLGARVDATEAEAEEGGKTEVTIEVSADEETEEDANVTAELDGSKKIVRLEDIDIPLADMPNESDNSISWWWLLIIALFGATGKAMYEHHKNKEEANAK